MNVDQPRKWTCGNCLLSNEAGMRNCAACSTARRDAPVGTKISGRWHGPPLPSLLNGAGKWRCNECLVENETVLEKCAACETPKAGTGAFVSGGGASGTIDGNQLQKSQVRALSFGGLTPPKPEGPAAKMSNEEKFALPPGVASFSFTDPRLSGPGKAASQASVGEQFPQSQAPASVSFGGTALGNATGGKDERNAPFGPGIAKTSTGHDSSKSQAPASFSLGGTALGRATSGGDKQMAQYASGLAMTGSAGGATLLPATQAPAAECDFGNGNKTGLERVAPNGTPLSTIFGGAPGGTTDGAMAGEGDVKEVDVKEILRKVRN